MTASRQHHPPAETLAAFVDGRLARAERRAVIEHLDACPDCYEVFAETARFLQDEEPRGEVVPIGRESDRPRFLRPLYWTAAAIAAVLLAVVIVPGLLPDGEPAADEELLTARLAGSLENPEVAAGAVMETARAPETNVQVPSVLGMGPLTLGRPSIFRVGVRLTDLRVAVAAGDRVAARRAGADLEPLTPDLALAIGGERWQDSTRQAVSAIERSVDAADRDELVAGARAEAGRLAAASGDVSFFTTPEGRVAYAGLAERLGEEAPAIDDLEALEEEFSEWVRTGG